MKTIKKQTGELITIRDFPHKHVKFSQHEHLCSFFLYLVSSKNNTKFENCVWEKKLCRKVSKNECVEIHTGKKIKIDPNTHVEPANMAMILAEYGEYKSIHKIGKPLHPFCFEASPTYQKFEFGGKTFIKTSSSSAKNIKTKHYKKFNPDEIIKYVD